MSKEGAYTVSRRRTVAETPNLRVRELGLAPGQCVPWHYHSRITDTFFCLEGTLEIETRAPRGLHHLAVGEHCAVPPKTAHEVRGKDGRPCRFLIVQGVGAYDFQPVGGQPAA